MLNRALRFLLSLFGEETLICAKNPITSAVNPRLLRNPLRGAQTDFRQKRFALAADFHSSNMSLAATLSVRADAAILSRALAPHLGSAVETVEKSALRRFSDPRPEAAAWTQ